MNGREIDTNRLQIDKSNGFVRKFTDSASEFWSFENQQPMKSIEKFQCNQIYYTI